MCDLDPKVKVIGQKAGICDGVPSTSALVVFHLKKIMDFTKTLVNWIGGGGGTPNCPMVFDVAIMTLET